MFEKFTEGHTLPSAYHAALFQLWEHGDLCECPDWNTRQKELSMSMVVHYPLREPMISRLIPCGSRELEQYRQEILDGILDFEILHGKWAYTYHDRMEYQFKFVVDELKRNPDSRRAVIDIRKPVDMKSNDPACLQHIQYFIRGGKLHCKVLFRSNDAVKATFMNAFALIMLQKRFADELGVAVGTYTHRANSFHAYERDWETLKAYYDKINRYRSESLTYNYVGDWADMMAEDRESIANMVKELRNRPYNTYKD